MKIFIIQRFFPRFREGFFDLLYEKMPFTFITCDRGIGKIVSVNNIDQKKYFKKSPYIAISEDYIIFYYLFFDLIKNKPDIIVTEGGQNTINNIFVLLYCFLFNKSYIVWDLGKAYLGNRKTSFFRKIYNFLHDFIIKKSSKIYTYNQAGKKYFVEKNRAHKVIVLNNTIDTKKVQSIKDEFNKDSFEYFKRRFLNCIKIGLFVGSLDENKNLEALISLYNELPVDYGLIIVGSGRQDYVDGLKKLNKKENTVFEGYKSLNELLNYYKLSSFTILPGLGGLSINQSMAFGVPVITLYADGGEKDLVTNSNTGFICSNIDEAKYIILNTSLDEWKAMGISAERLIYSEFSIENMVTTFLENL